MIEVNQITRKDGKPYPQLQKQVELFARLVDSGMSKEEASRFIDKGKETPKSTFRYRVKRYESFKLAHPKAVLAAANRVLKTIQMEPEEQEKDGIKTKVYPSFTNALDASKQVLDRADPLKHINVNITAEIDPIDLSEYTSPGLSQGNDALPIDNNPQLIEQDTQVIDNVDSPILHNVHYQSNNPIVLDSYESESGNR